jgi:hypothetical protein
LGPTPLAARDQLLGQLDDTSARRRASTIDTLPAITAR